MVVVGVVVVVVSAIAVVAEVVSLASSPPQADATRNRAAITAPIRILRGGTCSKTLVLNIVRWFPSGSRIEMIIVIISMSSVALGFFGCAPANGFGIASTLWLPAIHLIVLPSYHMDGIYSVTMGDRGRIVVPAEVRARHGFDPGAVLVFTESPWGLVLTTRKALLARIQSELEGSHLVDELLTDRKRQATIEDEG